MNTKSFILLAGLVLASFFGSVAYGQTLILADDYNVANVNSGFALGEGVNSGINPPDTRLTGLAAPDLRYYRYSGTKVYSAHTISTAQKWSVARVDNSGVYTLGPGAGAFDFSTLLRSVSATPALPSVYEVRFKMSNPTSPGNQRASFGLTSDLGGVAAWDFGIQLHRETNNAPRQQISRRIDVNSYNGIEDLNTLITNMVDGTYGLEYSFVIRVTDAGTEPLESSTFSSRIQLSMDGGATWFYDTQTDPELPGGGWRLDTFGRYFFWDIAAWGRMTFDDFSVTWISGPGPSATQVWTGGGTDDNWSTGANWLSGSAPESGDKLIFNGTQRQVNLNNISPLIAPWLTFSNGGFQLGGSELTLSSSVTNLAGDNLFGLPTKWTTSSAKYWHIASGSQVTLNGAGAIDVLGNHTFSGGGTLRLASSLAIGSIISSANPAVVINDGRFVLDGASASFTSVGGFRLGSSDLGTTVAELVLTNGATFYLSKSGGACRVGDSANGVVNRLLIDNSTLTMSGGDLGVPWAAGATGEVVQVGGWVSGCDLDFSHGGAGVGTYSIQNGILEPRQIARNNAGDFAGIYFDNAILRTYVVANNPFMSGLDVAEIRNGGLTLDVTGADATLGADLVFASPFSGVGGLTKSGTYAAVLTGANTYAGTTFVQQGKLVLPTVQTNAGAVLVADGTELGVLVTAQDTSLTAGSLSLGSGSPTTLSFNLGSFVNPTAPLMTVSSLAANGQVTVNVSGGSLLIPGTITLVKYSGAIGGGGTFVEGTLPANLNADVVVNPGSIDLVIHGVQGYQWTGAVDGNWDFTTANWLDGLTLAPSAYSDGFTTLFLDGAATGNVNLTGEIRPSVILVNNGSLPYVLSGGSLITDYVQKAGTGTVTRVEATADQVGVIELNAGSLVLSNSMADVTMTNILTDTSAGLGTLVKQGTSILTVASTNSTYDGAILVQEGALKLGATSALGSTNGSTTIANGTSLDVANVQAPHEPVFVSGAGVGGQGAIVNNTVGGLVQNNLTDVTMLGDTVFGSVEGTRWDIRVRNATGPGPGLRGNGYNFTKVGLGEFSISAQRHFGAATPYWEMNLGDILINEGIMAFEESTTLGNPGKSFVLMPGTRVNFFDLGLTNPILRQITMTDAVLSWGGQATHTNVINGDILMSGAVSLLANNGTFIVNGAIKGDAALLIGARAGVPGVVLLNGANTLTGDTTVTNNAVGGTGSLAGNLIVTRGWLTPGVEGIGTFIVNGNATLGGTNLMELDRSKSPNSDRLVVGGGLTFGGALQVVLGAGAPAPQAGDVYQLFSQGGSGLFTSISLPALSGDLMWNTSRLAVDGTISVAVPPTTIGTITLSGGDLTLTGSGGTAGGTYYVVTSTNIAAPLASWTPLATNVFGPGGSFTFTTNIVGDAPAGFFRVLVP